jgi:transposase-like protein
MGSPKGKKHRSFSQEEKVKFVQGFLSAHVSINKYATDNGLHSSVLRRWISDYAELGEAGLASHKNQRGNRYAALHSSKSLDITGQLELRMLKLEADVARLKKGYLTKGCGSNKVFVTYNGKNFKLSKN